MEVNLKKIAFYYLSLLMLLFNLQLFSQSHTMSKTPQKRKCIQRVTTLTPPDTWHTEWSEDQPNDYSFLDWINGGVNYWLIIRTGFKFDLSDIPSYALNITADIEVDNNGLIGDSKIVLISDDTDFNYVGEGYNGVFTVVESGLVLFTVPKESTVLHNVTSHVVSRISQGYINFGVKAGVAGAVGSITIILHIDYEVPITAQNNFSGGLININVDNPATSKTTPSTFSVIPGVSTVTLQAVDQNDGTYDRIWNDTEAPLYPSKWEKVKFNQRTFKSWNQSYSFTAAEDDGNTIYEAGLRKLCNITFKNQHSGGENGGTIKVNSTTYNSPTSTFNVVEQNQITASAIDHKINEIDFKFEKWNDNSTQQTNHSFYPSSTTQYKAIFEGTPKFGQAVRNLHFNSYNPRVQQYVKLYWNEHPSSNVTQYKIWRKGKEKNGSTIPEQLIATVNRGTTTYTDYDYYLTSGYSDALLQYDVQAYYQPDNTVSDQEYITVYGEGSGVEKTAAQDSTESFITTYEYGISNYPNPYNPSTTINFQIKETGNVTITVYDALGRKVKELVNEVKQPGSYNILFDGTNLSSGIYFYTMRVNNFTASKKMLLTK